MRYGKQEVLKLLEEIPDEAFDVERFVQDLAFRCTVQQRLEDAENGVNSISDEDARKRFKWR